MPATKQIDAMTAATALGGTEEIPAVQSAATVKITAAQIKTFTSASPTLVTPVLGVATGTSLALGGATIGSNALAVTGSAVFNAKVVLGGNTLAVQSSTGKALLYIDGVFGWTASGSADASTDTGLSRISAGVIGVGTGAQGSTGGTIQASAFSIGGASISNSGNSFLLNNLGSGLSAFLNVAGTATLQHGAVDAASPVAQTIKFQDVVAGTSNTAGVNATIQAPAGTGTGAGGSLIFQVAPAGSTGTAKNAQATALTIDSTKKVTLAGDLQLSNAYVATPQVPTGYITIYDSTGTAYKVSVNV